MQSNLFAFYFQSVWLKKFKFLFQDQRVSAIIFFSDFDLRLKQRELFFYFYLNKVLNMIEKVVIVKESTTPSLTFSVNKSPV